MTAELCVVTLLRFQAASALAAVLVLASRRAVRRLFGPELAYKLWWAPPLAGVSSLFPSLADFLSPASAEGAASGLGQSALAVVFCSNEFWRLHSGAALIAWSIGAGALTMAFLAGEIRYRRRAALGQAGPAIVGVAAPRLVVPSDYGVRFTDKERALIRRHERVHVEQNHPMANLIGAGLQVVCWFDPLAHFAASAARIDQELACDYLTLAGRPGDRRAYGEALLKAHALEVGGPLSCALLGAQTASIETRLGALKRPKVGLRRHLAGLTCVGAFSLGLVWGFWACAPGAGLDRIRDDASRPPAAGPAGLGRPGRA